MIEKYLKRECINTGSKRAREQATRASKGRSSGAPMRKRENPRKTLSGWGNRESLRIDSSV
jgi:hypothetical protein